MVFILESHQYLFSVGVIRFEIQLFGAITLLIAVTTVGFKSLRAATAYPVDSLRYE